MLILSLSCFYSNYDTILILFNSWTVIILFKISVDNDVINNFMGYFTCKSPYFTKYQKNKKVLLRERKRHTAHRIASTRYAALSNPDLVGGVPWVPPDHPDLVEGGTPSRPGQGVPRVPPSSIPPKLGWGTPFTIQTWLGGYHIQTWLGGYPPSSRPGWGGILGTPQTGMGYPPHLGQGIPLPGPGMGYPLPGPGMGYPPT